MSVKHAYCQKLETNAEYYNSNGVLYKIERKFLYKSDNAHIYLRITNDEVVFVKRKVKEHKDTLVMTECYGRYVTKFKSDWQKSLLNFDLEFDSRGDTTFFIYHFENDSTSTDTLLPGQCRSTKHKQKVS